MTDFEEMTKPLTEWLLHNHPEDACIIINTQGAFVLHTKEHWEHE